MFQKCVCVFHSYISSRSWLFSLISYRLLLNRGFKSNNKYPILHLTPAIILYKVLWWILKKFLRATYQIIFSFIGRKNGRIFCELFCLLFVIFNIVYLDKIAKRKADLIDWENLLVLSYEYSSEVYHHSKTWGCGSEMAIHDNNRKRLYQVFRRRRLSGVAIMGMRGGLAEIKTASRTIKPYLPQKTRRILHINKISISIRTK